MVNVLVVGSGGREHVLAWKFHNDGCVVYVAPGNDGMQYDAEIRPGVKVGDFEGLAALVRKHNVGVTVVGPEQPLVDGIVDFWHEQGLVEEGHLIFGPAKQAAQLEGSKAFAKQFMQRYSIPTAPFKVFDNPGLANDYIISHGAPIVVKASGLAAGKGSLVCSTIDDALVAVRDIMVQKRFGDAGDQIVIEDFMEGEEASILALTDGKSVVSLAASQDHKPVYDGDKGPNTGGMGAYAPAPIVSDEVMEKVNSRILLPTVRGMAEAGMPYVGCLYAGLMIKDGEPRVVEYNIRFGDPEAQPVLMLLENNLYDLLQACVDGTLDEHTVRNKPGAACCVVMASEGYPEKYEKGRIISGLDAVKLMHDVQVFHAGTKLQDRQYLTNGGRVLGVTGLGNTIKQAQENAYKGVACIHWEGEYHRTDIAGKAIR